MEKEISKEKEELLENLLKELEDASIYGSLYTLDVYSLVDEDFVGEDKVYTLKDVQEIIEMTEREMARAILFKCGIDDE